MNSNNCGMDCNKSRLKLHIELWSTYLYSDEGFNLKLDNKAESWEASFWTLTTKVNCYSYFIWSAKFLTIF